MADAALWKTAHTTDLHSGPLPWHALSPEGMAPGKILVSDHCSFFNLLISLCSPQNAKELFNLRHSVLCNIIKHIFGVLKHQWWILQIPPEYDMDIQAHIPAALCALHNFMHSQEPDTYFLEIDDAKEDWNLVRDMEEEVNEEALGHLRDGPTTVAER